MKKIKDIDFNDKDIVATEYHFSFSKKERPEGWTLNDEIMMLSLYLQREMIMRESQEIVHTLMDWRKNISKAVIKTLDKIEDDNIFQGLDVKNFSDYDSQYLHQCYVSKLNCSGNVLSICGLDNDDEIVLTEAGKESLDKEMMLYKAKELAKAELLQEQEEAEEEAKKDVRSQVFPLKHYGK